MRKQIESIEQDSGTTLDSGLFSDSLISYGSGDQSAVLNTLLDSNNQLIEAYGRLLRNSEETKELIQAVGQLVYQLQESKNQEAGLNFFGNIIEQGISNPDGFAKVIDIFQSLQGSGLQQNSGSQSPSQKVEGFQPAPKKRASRKKTELS